MDSKQIELIKEKLGIELSEEKIELFNRYETLFLEKNSQVNLISKNDEKLLFEKHIFDSLAFHLFANKFEGSIGKLLDIGTGGGFPSLPLAILYKELNVFALDSIKKKVNVVESIGSDLGLENIFPICERAENLQLKSSPHYRKQFDCVTTRAVAPMDVILKYALVNLKKGGYFVAYKSKRAQDELKEAQKTLKLFGAKVVDIIEYTLPLEEAHERNLIVISK